MRLCEVKGDLPLWNQGRLMKLLGEERCLKLGAWHKIEVGGLHK